MIVIIDNYDSFTYNLVQYFGERERDIRVFRNDAVDVAHLRAMKPDRIVISPGPCTPNEAGISIEVIRALGPEIPLLGVCLGHQCIGAAYGGKVVGAPVIMHGKVSAIRHEGNRLFAGIPSPFTATRYHSLIIHRGDGRRRDHGRGAPQAPDLGGSVPPGEHSDGLRQADHRQLHGAGLRRARRTRARRAAINAHSVQNGM